MQVIKCKKTHPLKYNSILNTGHSYGNTQNTMEIIEITQRGSSMKSLGKFTYLLRSPTK
jgi:hypothetical protein